MFEDYTFEITTTYQAISKPMMNICYFDLSEDTSVEFYLSKSNIIKKSIQICCQQNIKPEYVRYHKYNFL